MHRLVVFPGRYKWSRRTLQRGVMTLTIPIFRMSDAL